MDDRGPFVSVLCKTMGKYLALKQALGRRYDGERRVLESLDRCLANEHSDLTAETFNNWCKTQEHVRSGVRRQRMRIVRNLALYRRRSDPTCFVPDRMLFPPPHQSVRPYIFTDTDIVKLLEVTRTLEPSQDNPLRADVFTLAITLLYTTGLRRGELLRMTLGDYDMEERALLVRESKFHKSRLLPLSADGVSALDHYIRARRARHLPLSTETPLIWHRRDGGCAYTGTGFGFVIRQLLASAQIRKPNGQLPRVHDFRHAFATHALLRWYRAGEDVQAKLPFLAAYMGHVSIVSTEHYLQLIEPLVSSASERFAARYAGLIRPLPSPGPRES